MSPSPTAGVKTVHLYVALSIMVATVIGSSVRVGQDIGVMTTKFDYMVEDVRSIKVNVREMSQAVQESKEKNLLQDAAIRQLEQPKQPSRIYVPPYRDFDR